MGGLKHIDVISGQADQACGEIRRLRPDEIERVLNFIYSLLAQRSATHEESGKPERLLEHQGRFSFNEGEREKLLDDLRNLRGGGKV